MRSFDTGSVSRSTGIYDVVEPVYSRVMFRRWRARGEPLPAPSAVKRRIIVEYAEKYRIRHLVETGTYKADTVRALRNDFETITSIELFPGLYERASRRCRKQKNARLLLGDSGSLLPGLVSSLDSTALFWLDAHYSGDGTADAVSGEAAPIQRELEAVLNADLPHIVLVDDAREFHRPAESGYPPISVIESVAHKYGYTLAEQHDVIRLAPA